MAGCTWHDLFEVISDGCIGLSVCGNSLATANASKIFARQHGWIQKDISWYRPEGEPDLKQTYGNGKVLYFGGAGEFGRFTGVVVKHGKTLMLSEGDGDIIYRGTWTASRHGIAIVYRLADSYKILRTEGAKEPDIPGPVENSSVLLDAAPSGKFSNLEFQGLK
jgi:hypothetical protein